MNCRLLLIDNTTSITHPWKKVLNENFATTEAVGGFEAVTKLSNTTFDLVIVNISLSHLNGVDAIRKIREKFYLIPIIVLYKQADFLNLKQVRAYGIQQALQDPVNVKHLILTISKLIPARRLQEKSALQTHQESCQQATTEERDEKYVDVEKQFYDGLSAIAACRFQDAIDIYDNLINLNNIKHEAWLKYINESFFQLGHCYANLGEYKTSSRHFAMFITKAPRHNFVKEALLHLGQNYEALKNFSKAVHYYNKVVQMRPMDSCTTKARKLITKLVNIS